MSSIDGSTVVSPWSSIIVDKFQTSPPSKASAFEARLERHRRFRKPIPDIATALSSSGWLATASYDKVRFYYLRDINSSTRGIKESRDSIKCHREWGRIRAIALSNDLLAIITYTHLIVLNYKVHGNIDQILIDAKLINTSEVWTPQSIAVRQVEPVEPGEIPFAWVAVGGQGKHGVKIYKYVYEAGWEIQSDRITLSCAQNVSSIGLVSFSPEAPNTRDRIIVCAAAASNQIYCWGIGRENHHRTPEPSWTFNCDVRKDGVPYTGAVKSIQIFLSPTKRMYIFCAINQKQGSQVLGSCIAPLDYSGRDERTALSPWQELSKDAIRRGVIGGTVTPSGRFIIAVEQGLMRLVTLQPMGNGGLGCITVPKPLQWRSSLTPTTPDVSGISVSVREEDGILEIMAVDGRGCVEFRCASVCDMLSAESPQAGLPLLPELPSEPCIRYELPDHTCTSQLTGESSGGESSWCSWTTDNRVFDTAQIQQWEVEDPMVPAYEKPGLRQLKASTRSQNLALVNPAQPCI